MPIFHVEMLTSVSPPAALVLSLADELGDLMGAPSGQTWVTLRTCSPEHYAESGGGAVPEWVFVRVLLRELPDEVALAALAEKITRVVAHRTDRPAENVHVLFEPAARGRMAFGGALVRTDPG